MDTPPWREDTSGGLTDEVKAEIQAAYRRWLKARGFNPRRGQRQMIAEIARALTRESDRLCVVEAGTGTGKTVAYCLAAIPLAQALDKSVVIATATVALQEQVAYRDLPDLAQNAGLEFTATLAKGRSRYVCLKRLDDGLATEQASTVELFDQLEKPPDADALAVYRAMRAAFADGSWDGDRDSWEAGVDVATWRPVTNDRVGCGASRCSFFHQCPFFKARQRVNEAEVVVANHDLVLADLSIGGGVVLPAPADTIYVLDEAHHLPDKTRSHFTVAARLKASGEWLAQALRSIETMARRFDEPRELKQARQRLSDVGDITNQLADAERMVRDLPFAKRDERTWIHRLPRGEVPGPLAELAAPLGLAFADIAKILGEVRECLDEVMDGSLQWPKADQAEAWLPVISQLAGRAESSAALFADFGNGGANAAARWATRRVLDTGAEDTELTSAPLDPGGILAAALWEVCYGAVATSATLCALGNFDRFRDLAGIGGASEARIASPFDFPRIATFSVPKMQSNPGDAAAHTEELAALLPTLLGLEPSALALFTSWRQFNAVAASLPTAIRERCLLQDTASKQRLVEDHRAAIDAGEPSYLFGLQSFAEGVDLPGDYCRHVIIAKIPFAVPDDPVDEALAEWLEAQGRNAFFEISVPDASLRLIQACGRLIRNETDGGRITLLDRRIVSRRYGQALLESLPPYRLEVA